jgi:hypothetical protein
MVSLFCSTCSHRILQLVPLGGIGATIGVIGGALLNVALYFFANDAYRNLWGVRMATGIPEFGQIMALTVLPFSYFFCRFKRAKEVSRSGILERLRFRR